MIVRKTHEDPSSLAGYQCVGKITTDSDGVGLITVTGKDYSGKITGISLICLDSTASKVKMYSAYVVSVAHSAGTTTITIQANQTVDSGEGTTDLDAFVGDVYYSFWLNEIALPTDQSTNNTLKTGI